MYAHEAGRVDVKCSLGRGSGVTGTLFGGVESCFAPLISFEIDCF